MTDAPWALALHGGPASNAGGDYRRAKGCFDRLVTEGAGATGLGRGADLL